MNKRGRMHKLDKPTDTECVQCGNNDETTCYRHYEGYRKHEYGKGTGCKVDDLYTAWLCTKCDEELSGFLKKESSRLETIWHSEQWLHLILKTQKQH